MFTYLNRKRGQSTLEYAVLIIIVIAALLSIQNYLKRGIQGGMKGHADDIGDQFSVGNTNVIQASRTHSHEAQTFGISGVGVQNSILSNETTNEAMRSVVVNVDQEYWGQ